MADPILSADEAELKNAQAKITYLGEQIKPVATVVFHPEEYKVSMVRFVMVEGRQEPYPNDAMPYTVRFTVTTTELKRMLSSVKSILEHAPAVKPMFLSFTVVREELGTIEGREFSIPEAVGQEFYSKLIAALNPANAAGRSVLGKQFGDVYPSVR